MASVGEMSERYAPRPVRRSALERNHAELGARWLGDDTRWPVSYDDLEAEKAAAATSVGLAEIGPLDKLLIRGPGAASAIAAVDADIWPLADDEILVMAAPDVDLAERVKRTLADTALSVCDVSSAWAVLRLAGPRVRAVLEELTAVDLSDAAVPNGGIVQGQVVAVRAIVARRDAANLPGFTILVARDEAAYLWEAIVAIGRPHQLQPVGPAAVGERTLEVAR